ncbi:MAG: GDSL-type esterase/lipase family protein [Clostridia bacterium]|nr:GDSL-type esterase/lipase family protein [Clostridia bacterium]
MSPLEIVLFFIICLIVALAIIILLVINGLRVNRIHAHNVLNQYAKKGQIVFFGDSLTDFYPLQEFFDTPTIYNRGIASDTTQNLLNRIDNIIELEPCKVFLLIGTNDIGKGKTVEYVIEQIDKIVDILTGRCAGVKIYIISQYPMLRTRNFYSFFLCALRTNAKLVKLSLATKQYAVEHGYTYIDCASVLTDSKGRLKREYTLDGLHVSTSAYAQVSTVLQQYIKQ